jgi:hypothetical protein
MIVGARGIKSSEWELEILISLSEYIFTLFALKNNASA